jgi:signal transduction histidine kinase
VLSAAKALLAVFVLPNYLPVLGIEALSFTAATGLAVFFCLLRKVLSIYLPLALVALVLEMYFFFPFFLTFDALQSLFLIATFFDILLLIALSCAPIGAGSIPGILGGALAVWLFLDRVRGEPLAFVVASYLIAALAGLIMDLFMRLRNDRARLAATLGETERLNRKLAIASARIMEQRRREHLATMTAGIAHEINNPITYLAGNIDFLQSHVDAVLDATAGNAGDVSRITEARHEVPEILESFRTGIATIQGVVRRLQNTFRSDRRESRVIILREVLESSVKGSGIDRDSRFIVELDVPGDLTVFADTADLYTVFVNLIRNAEEAGCGELIVSAQGNEQAAILRFADDGAGIPPEKRERVFDPFYSDKKRHDGMGVGLALCKAILEQQGGSIRIEDSHLGGACVVVVIPREV